MKKPTVAILADPLDDQNAGIHVYTREAIDALLQCDQFNYILIRQKKGIYDSQNVQEIVIPTNQSLLDKFIRTFIKIPRLIKKLNPDIVIEPAHFGPFNIQKRIKRVTIIHDLTPIKFPHWHRLHSQLLQRFFLRGILKRASLVLTNSKNTLKDLNSHYPFTSEKSIMIYPGIDPSYSVPEKEIGLKKEPFLLFTGTIEPRKNLITLLKAYQLFREQNKNKFKLIITGGKGWKSDEFYSELEQHPFFEDIELKGYVSKEELKELYKKATVFIYPSLYEGFGFPVAEAMNCGAPCIASQSSSLTEVGGDAVLYFNPENVNELAQNILAITESEKLQKELIIKGKIQANKFKWSNFAKEFENELMRLLE